MRDLPGVSAAHSEADTCGSKKPYAAERLRPPRARAWGAHAGARLDGRADLPEKAGPRAIEARLGSRRVDCSVLSIFGAGSGTFGDCAVGAGLDDDQKSATSSPTLCCRLWERLWLVRSSVLVLIRRGDIRPP